ncbi:MAG TPA: hypothetical protein VGS19_38005 [Streptosporangiaceae bacterium]|nr:hypothetical protein [Streptosporangiaceae bacterium]
MTGSTAALIAIPVVAAVCLVGWLVAVFLASSHPRQRHIARPQHWIEGGVFFGDPRQQMPRWGAPAAAQPPPPDKPRA